MEDQTTEPPGPARRPVLRLPGLEVHCYAKSSPTGATKRAPDIGPDEWISLRIDVDDTRLTVAVNRTEALTLIETKAAPAAGNIGLFVDIGSESFFSNLNVTPN